MRKDIRKQFAMMKNEDRIELFKLYIFTLSFFSNMLVYLLLLFCITTLNQYCLVEVKETNENKVLEFSNSVLKSVLVCVEFFQLLFFHGK